MTEPDQWVVCCGYWHGDKLFYLYKLRRFREEDFVIVTKTRADRAVPRERFVRRFLDEAAARNFLESMQAGVAEHNDQVRNRFEAWQDALARRDNFIEVNRQPFPGEETAK